MSTLREEFKIQLNRLTTSPFFVAKLIEYGLEEFKYEIMCAKHRDDVCKLLGSQMTREGGNIASVIYNICETDTKAYDRYSHLIDHGIKTGLSYVVLDKNNKMAAVNLVFDICDKSPYADYSKYGLKYIKRSEFTSLAQKNHSFFDSLRENIKYGLIQKGECIDSAVGVLCRDYQRVRGCSYMFLGIKWVLAYSLPSVKYFTVDASHTAAQKSLLRFDHHFNSLTQNDEDIAFYTQTSDVKQFFIDQFKNDEWYKNNVDQQFVMKNISKLNAVYQVVCFKKLRNKYDIEQFFQHHVDAMRIAPKSRISKL